MASKNNKKKPATATNFSTLTPKQYVKQRARKLPIVKAYINSDFLDNGIACVVILRQQGGEKYLIGRFMVDIFCLGVKNTLFQMGVPQSDIDSNIVDYYNKMGLPYQEYDPTYAQNVIWGAYEYAEDLGFAPPKYSDFDVTQYILDPADEIEFMDVPFGRDGKPLFFAGPNDNVQKIRNTLAKKVGVDGYDFVAALGGSMMDLQMFGDDDWENYDEEDDLDEENGFDDYEEVK